VSAPEDAMLLPLAYQRVKVEANKAKLKDALKAGELVDGCGLLTTRSVVIRSSK
jgi:predicted homoserine dehydrogenase-like protein